MKFDKLTEAYMNVCLKENVGSKVFVLFLPYEEEDLKEFKAVCRTEEAAKDLVEKLNFELVKAAGVRNDPQVIQTFIKRYGHYYEEVDLVG